MGELNTLTRDIKYYNECVYENTQLKILFQIYR